MPFKDPEKQRESQRRSRKRHAKKVRQYNKYWALANPDKIKANQKRYRLRHPIRTMLAKAKQRAKQSGLDYDLEESKLSIPKTCPWLGIPITLEGPKDNSPALDRVDNTRGYTQDNVEIISWKANRLKSDASLDELIALGRRARRLKK